MYTTPALPYRPITKTVGLCVWRCGVYRFRFTVQGGEGFDVLLAGKGTYQEDTVPNPPPHI